MEFATFSDTGSDRNLIQPDKILGEQADRQHSNLFSFQLACRSITAITNTGTRVLAEIYFTEGSDKTNRLPDVFWICLSSACRLRGGSAVALILIS